MKGNSITQLNKKFINQSANSKNQASGKDIKQASVQIISQASMNIIN